MCNVFSRGPVSQKAPNRQQLLYCHYTPCKVGATDIKFLTCPEWAIMLNRVKGSIYFCTGN